MKLVSVFSGEDQFDLKSKGFFKTERFFYNDNTSLRQTAADTLSVHSAIGKTKKILLKYRPGTVQMAVSEVVQSAAKNLGWEIALDTDQSKPYSREADRANYDIVIMGSEIGGGFESWVIDMLFCSDVGPRWPDPSGRICELTKSVAAGNITNIEAAQKFQDYLIEDAALIPAFHRGGYYLLSDDLDIKSLGPMVTRIRFEEIGPRQ